MDLRDVLSEALANYLQAPDLIEAGQHAADGLREALAIVEGGRRPTPSAFDDAGIEALCRIGFEASKGMNLGPPNDRAFTRAVATAAAEAAFSAVEREDDARVARGCNIGVRVITGPARAALRLPAPVEPARVAATRWPLPSVDTIARAICSDLAMTTVDWDTTDEEHRDQCRMIARTMLVVCERHDTPAPSAPVEVHAAPTPTPSTSVREGVAAAMRAADDVFANMENEPGAAYPKMADAAIAYLAARFMGPEAVEAVRRAANESPTMPNVHVTKSEATAMLAAAAKAALGGEVEVAPGRCAHCGCDKGERERERIKERAEKAEADLVAIADALGVNRSDVVAAVKSRVIEHRERGDQRDQLVADLRAAREALEAQCRDTRDAARERDEAHLWKDGSWIVARTWPERRDPNGVDVSDEWQAEVERRIDALEGK
jgi:hypothetical protein